MSKNVAEPTPERRVSNIEFRTRQLERRPALVPRDGLGDRAIEYLWGGPHLNWFVNSPGITNAVDFQTWVRDYTVDFDGYLSNGGGSDGDVAIFAAPLGPRWSVWDIDICLGEGPDYGVIKVDIATQPFGRSCEGLNAGPDPDGSPLGSLGRFDIPATTETLAGPYQVGSVWTNDPAGLAEDKFFPMPNIGVGCYRAVESFNHYNPELGTHLRITGEYGDLLTQGPHDCGCTFDTGGCLDSGDGVMYYFRVRVDGKEASSSGFKGRIQAFRLSRAFENGGTLV